MRPQSTHMYAQAVLLTKSKFRNVAPAVLSCAGRLQNLSHPQWGHTKAQPPISYGTPSGSPLTPFLNSLKKPMLPPIRPATSNGQTSRIQGERTRARVRMQSQLKLCQYYIMTWGSVHAVSQSKTSGCRAAGIRQQAALAACKDPAGMDRLGKATLLIAPSIAYLSLVDTSSRMPETRLQNIRQSTPNNTVLGFLPL